MNTLKKIFSFSNEKKTAHKLYKTIVKQARKPVFYEQYGVSDTFDCRFDMISLHMILVMRRLKSDNDKTHELSQALFDFMFDDFDLNLRELGIGDMGVLKRVKKMAQAFYGRLHSYDEALDKNDVVQLSKALKRNLYRGLNVSKSNLQTMTSYTLKQSEHLDKCKISSLISGNLEFYSVTNHLTKIN